MPRSSRRPSGTASAAWTIRRSATGAIARASASMAASRAWRPTCRPSRSPRYRCCRGRHLMTRGRWRWREPERCRSRPRRRRRRATGHVGMGRSGRAHRRRVSSWWRRCQCSRSRRDAFPSASSTSTSPPTAGPARPGTPLSRSARLAGGRVPGGPRHSRRLTSSPGRCVRSPAASALLRAHPRCTLGMTSSLGVGVPCGGWWDQPQAESNCVVVRRRGEEAGGELATRGTRTAYKARRSGRVGTERQSPKPPRGRSVNAAGMRGRLLALSEEGSVGVLRCPSRGTRSTGGSRCPSVWRLIVGWEGTATAERAPLAAEQSAAAIVPAGIASAGKGQTRGAGQGRLSPWESR